MYVKLYTKCTFTKLPYSIFFAKVILSNTYLKSISSPIVYQNPTTTHKKGYCKNSLSTKP